MPNIIQIIVFGTKPPLFGYCGYSSSYMTLVYSNSSSVPDYRSTQGMSYSGTCTVISINRGSLQKHSVPFSLFH